MMCIYTQLIVGLELTLDFDKFSFACSLCKLTVYDSITRLIYEKGPAEQAVCPVW
jgi:hypothetical protein